MKKRALTALGIVVVVALAFVLKMLVKGGDYFFDAFILIITCFACFEFAKMLKSMDKPCYKYLATFFPVLLFINHILAFIYDAQIGLGWAIIIDVCLAVLSFAGAFVYGLISFRRFQKEIRLKKLENTTPARLALFRALNTSIAFIYPAFLLMFMTFINHFADFSSTFAFAEIAESQGIAIETVASYAKYFSFTALIFMFVIPAATDTFAYLMGSTIGGKKLCPKISPNKTISGAVGGLVWCVLLSICTFFILNSIPVIGVSFEMLGFKVWHIAIISLICSVVGQLGDIFESFLKRKAGVKDSGKILPGHGGMLDRCDSYVFVAPVLLLAFSIILLCL